MVTSSTNPRLTHLVHLNTSTQTKQPQLDPPDLQRPRQRLVEHHQVVHLILARPELFQHPDILHRSVDGIHGNGELDLPRQEETELRELERVWSRRFGVEAFE